MKRNVKTVGKARKPMAKMRSKAAREQEEKRVARNDYVRAQYHADPQKVRDRKNREYQIKAVTAAVAALKPKAAIQAARKLARKNVKTKMKAALALVNAVDKGVKARDVRAFA